ncbi:MHS family MFS transporter [Rothia sp. AR01]|uniref:MHS family MFS transporter n=1 Tax=Rothia santali TaxID=2949643 RepID=A0A9X2H9B3_9MICC|nr:MFS transporter [Rothia santali]MCP3425091.1 MHS family MFS transporter [Rothia santali]
MNAVSSTERDRPEERPPGRERTGQLRRATLASSVGSALEYYDFALYGLASALIFSRLFFPSLDPATGLISSFAVYGVGFLARPLGGLFFGVMGDRIGRKAVLVVTILLMGGSSTLIGALPTYEQAGLLAPCLLVLMRLAQGFGAGAEQAGATVLMSEVAPARRRGFFAALPFIGIQGGTLLAAVVFAGLGALPEETLLGWAWRVPFLSSVVLIVVAVYIRARLRETPAFAELAARDEVARQPLRELFTRSGRLVLQGVGLRMAENGGSYLFQGLAVAYATGTVAQDPWVGSLAVAVGSLIGLVSVPLTGALSDRVGRVPVYRAGALILAAGAVPAWWLLSLGIPAVTIAVIALGIGVAVNTMLGPQCALLPRLFGNRSRYLGVAMSREVSAVLAGGLAGVVGASLIKAFDGSWIPLAAYTLLLALITLATTFRVPETRGRDLTVLDDARAASAPTAEAAPRTQPTDTP